MIEEGFRVVQRGNLFFAQRLNAAVKDARDKAPHKPKGGCKIDPWEDISRGEAVYGDACVTAARPPTFSINKRGVVNPFHPWAMRSPESKAAERRTWNE